MISIKVYGPGCAKCEGMEALAKHVAGELGLNAQIEKVTDVMLFAVAGVIVTPALAINDKVVVSGRIPAQNEMRRLLLDAVEKTPSGTKNGTATPESEKTAPCGCGTHTCCNDGGTERTVFSWQKLVIWIAVIIAVLTVIKFANREAGKTERQSGEVPAAETLNPQANTQQQETPSAW